MLRIIFLCEGQNSTFIVQFKVTAVCIIFPEVATDVERVVQKSCFLPVESKSLKDICDGVKFFGKTACSRPATLLKLKEFDHKYRTAANSRKGF